MFGGAAAKSAVQRKLRSLVSAQVPIVKAILAKISPKTRHCIAAGIGCWPGAAATAGGAKAQAVAGAPSG